jgi:ADP-heptose:LPS heptosyltransferase
LNAVNITSSLARLAGLGRRHFAVFKYVLTVLLPVILKTRRRPVIFLRDAGLGDIICSVPAARELMKRHPGATFIYNCHEDFTALPRLYGIADRVTALKPIGLVGHWYGWLIAGFYQFSHGDPLVVRTTVKDFCDQFNVPGTDEHPPLAIPAALRERAKKILAAKNLNPESLIVIHPGPTMPVKEWPPELWAQLVARLRAEGFTNIAQLGVGRHIARGNVEVTPVAGAVSLMDMLSLEEAVAVIGLARLHIGIDSGLLHIAASAGTPLVGIFGNTLPHFLIAENHRRTFAVSTVECRGCAHYLASTPYTTDCPHHIRCMKEISVGEVASACLTQLTAARK